MYCTNAILMVAHNTNNDAMTTSGMPTCCTGRAMLQTNETAIINNTHNPYSVKSSSEASE